MFLCCCAVVLLWRGRRVGVLVFGCFVVCFEGGSCFVSSRVLTGCALDWSPLFLRGLLFFALLLVWYI